MDGSLPAAPVVINLFPSAANRHELGAVAFLEATPGDCVVYSIEFIMFYVLVRVNTHMKVG